MLTNFIIQDDNLPIMYLHKTQMIGITTSNLVVRSHIAALYCVGEVTTTTVFH